MPHVSLNLRDVGIRQSAVAGMPALSWEYSLVPGAESLPFALRIVTASGLAQPSLVQKFCPQFSHRSVLVNFDVADETEALAERAGGAKFAGGQRHREFQVSNDGRLASRRELYLPTLAHGLCCAKERGNGTSAFPVFRNPHPRWEKGGFTKVNPPLLGLRHSELAGAKPKRSPYIGIDRNHV